MEYLFLYVPISLALLIVFWIRNVRLFKRSYSSDMLSLEMVHTYNLFHGKLLDAHYNFFNFTASLITKFVGFTVFSIIMFLLCYNDLQVVAIAVPFIHGIFLAMTLWIYWERIVFYKKIDVIHKDAFRPIFKASVCLPVYQTILQIMLLIALFLDY